MILLFSGNCLCLELSAQASQRAAASGNSVVSGSQPVGNEVLSKRAASSSTKAFSKYWATAVWCLSSSDKKRACS